MQQEHEENHRDRNHPGFLRHQDEQDASSFSSWYPILFLSCGLSDVALTGSPGLRGQPPLSPIKLAIVISRVGLSGCECKVELSNTTDQ